MKNFKRDDLLFSLCGLNCGLCPMHLGGYCPGCGGGDGNQSCAFAKCSLKQGDTAYCFQCPSYPCDNYQGADDYDSFITHYKRTGDMEKAERIGRDAYHLEQQEKIRILRYLLDNFNDGRRKTLFCTAVNLLELPDLYHVTASLQEFEEQRKAENLSMKERAMYAAALLQSAAGKRQLPLKLRKKPRQK